METQTTSGEVGAVVKILGTDLTGATSVSFNGTAAAFTVVAPSLITATVPAGATTGTVQVTKCAYVFSFVKLPSGDDGNSEDLKIVWSHLIEATP